MKIDTDQVVDRHSDRRLEHEILAVGRDLSRSLVAVLNATGQHGGGANQGPLALARTLGIDKVLASRLLKAMRTRDPIAVVHHTPGPEPLRRLLRAAGAHGVRSADLEPAERAVDRFERLIREEIGDRSGLDAIISAWLPEARRDFELRRKQAAFRAMSQLKGAMAHINLSCVLLHPSSDGRHIDVVWVIGLLGLQRVRPGITVKFATRRMAPDEAPRHPTTLDGNPIDSADRVRLDAFCDAPPAQVHVQHVGDVVHYVLADHGFGRHSAVDHIHAEVNLCEMPRYVPRDSGRKGNVFAEIGTPSKCLLFDVLVHEDLYPGAEPGLRIYDTALDGVADINDPSRDIDRLDLVESVQHLGRGAATLRFSQMPRYVELIRHVFERMQWTDEAFRCYRCRVDYPVYGSQVAMTFDPPPLP